jgi:SAM-dependent methyltransferase
MALDVEDSVMECPVCEYPRSRVRYQLKDRFFGTVEESFPLFECTGCGLLFQEPEAVEGRLAEFYPEGYWWNESGPLAPLEAKYREFVLKRDQVGFVSSVLAEPKDSRLLDIGCGSGAFVKVARQAGIDAFGLDSSQEAVDAGVDSGIEQLMCGTEQDLRDAGDQYDVVTMFHTLEHVVGPFQYLKKVRDLLKRPGSLIVQVPNRESCQARVFGPRWYGLDCPRHVCNYTRHSLLYLLGRCGFRIRKTRHFSLRDNAASIASSTFPGLDPMGAKVRNLREAGKHGTVSSIVKEIAYLGTFLSAQPLALFEAGLGRGGTITVHATWE